MQQNADKASNYQPASKNNQLAFNLKQLRNRISMNNYQLLQLTHNEQKLISRLNELNHIGVMQINVGSYHQALVYFGQCQNILEYAASCGRTIDRHLIIAILNNEAVAYQKNQQTDKAASYVEAVIYNLSIFLQNCENSSILEELLKFSYDDFRDISQIQQFISLQGQNIQTIILRNFQLSVFQLQYSGLNSQNQNHQISLKKAKKSLKTLHKLCIICFQYEYLKDNSKVTWKCQILQQLFNISQLSQLKDYNQISNQFLKLAKKGHSNFNAQRQSKYSMNESVRNMVKHINLEEIFILKSKEIKENHCERSFGQIGHFDHACLTEFHLKVITAIMAAFFAISAEIQQIANSQYEQHYSSNNILNSIPSIQQERQNSKVLSQIYLMKALIVGYKYLPFPTFLLNYLLSLYQQNHPESLISNRQTNELKSVNNNLTEKYKNYLLEKAVNISEDKSVEQVNQEVNQQMRQSKKLYNLLKPQSNVGMNKNQKIGFLDIPSVESIEINHSLSNKFLSKAEKLPKREQKISFHTNRSRRKFNINTQSNVITSTDNTVKTQSQFRSRFTKRDGKTNKPNQLPNKSKSKSNSKSYSKNTLKSNSKLKSFKTLKTNGKMHPMHSAKIIQKIQKTEPVAVLGLATTIKDKSKSKREDKSSGRSQYYGKAGSDFSQNKNRFGSTTKKIITKEKLIPNRNLASKKTSLYNRIQSAKLNKVNSASKFLPTQPISQVKYGQQKIPAKINKLSRMKSKSKSGSIKGNLSRAKPKKYEPKAMTTTKINFAYTKQVLR